MADIAKNMCKAYLREEPSYSDTISLARPAGWLGVPWPLRAVPRDAITPSLWLYREALALARNGIPAHCVTVCGKTAPSDAAVSATWHAAGSSVRLLMAITLPGAVGM